jgi:hypothetical protein
MLTAGRQIMNEYKVKFPELWKPGLVEDIDYVVRGVYKFQNKASEWLVQCDRFYTNNVKELKNERED